MSSQTVNLDAWGIEKCADIVCEHLSVPGAVVLLPTETVYGLVANFGDETAIEKIYRLKRRPHNKKLGCFIWDWKKLSEYGVVLAGLPEQLFEQYTPGAITVISPCENGDTLGARVPDHPLLQSILKKINRPLVQTSANASGFPDAVSCEEALKQLDGVVDCAVDGGQIAENACGSTVVDATGTEIRILRQGAIYLNK